MSVPFYLDATLVPVGRALDAVRGDVWYPGKPGCEVTSTDVADRDWVAVAARRGWAIVTRDRHIRTRPGARDVLAAAGLRVFCLTGSAQDTRWQQLRLLVQRWEAMQAACRRPGPFLVTVTARGLQRLPVTVAAGIENRGDA